MKKIETPQIELEHLCKALYHKTNWKKYYKNISDDEKIKTIKIFLGEIKSTMFWEFGIDTNEEKILNDIKNINLV